MLAWMSALQENYQAAGVSLFDEKGYLHLSIPNGNRAGATEVELAKQAIAKREGD